MFGQKQVESNSYPYLLAASELSNAQYHALDAVSNSVLTDFSISPARVKWRQNAPIDDTKLRALNMGSALHTRLLEPHLFDSQFAIKPQVDGRTTFGKNILNGFEDFAKNKIILSNEEGIRLDSMIGSIYAHPTAAWLLDMPGLNEASIFWTDKETALPCRCRPDKIVDPIAAGEHILVDLKKTANIDHFRMHIEDYRYHVQAAMYQDGYYQLFGTYPLFVFLVVSESAECGRYPVHVFILNDGRAECGWRLYREDLEQYHQCKQSGQWPGFEIL